MEIAPCYAGWHRGGSVKFVAKSRRTMRVGIASWLANGRIFINRFITRRSRSGPKPSGLPNGRLLIKRLISGRSRTGPGPAGLPNGRILIKRLISDPYRTGPGPAELPNGRILMKRLISDPRRIVVLSPPAHDSSHRTNLSFERDCSGRPSSMHMWSPHDIGRES